MRGAARAYARRRIPINRCFSQLVATGYARFELDELCHALRKTTARDSTCEARAKKSLERLAVSLQSSYCSCADDHAKLLVRCHHFMRDHAYGSIDGSLYNAYFALMSLMRSSLALGCRHEDPKAMLLSSSPYLFPMSADALTDRLSCSLESSGDEVVVQ